MSLLQIYIADNNAIYIEGIKSILEKYNLFKIESETDLSKDFVNEVFKHKTDILLFDCFNMKNGLEKVDLILSNNKKLKLVIISDNQNINETLTVISKGIKGYILKNCALEEFIIAINKIAKGENYYSSEVSKRLIYRKSNNNYDLLSFREKQIIQLFSSGLNALEIAQNLYLSKHTINTHRKNILKKLNLNSTTEMVLFCLKNGIIPEIKKMNAIVTNK